LRALRSVYVEARLAQDNLQAAQDLQLVVAHEDA
jgi:hypothetical protein